jgi:hypothetical protein
MAALDQPPPIVCVIVREEAGDRVQLRGRVVSPEAGQGTYSLHVIKTGPAGSSNIHMGGPFTLAANVETFVGLANFNVDRNASYTTDFTVTMNDRTYRCALPDGDSK